MHEEDCEENEVEWTRKREIKKVELLPGVHETPTPDIYDNLPHINVCTKRTAETMNLNGSESVKLER